MRPILFLDIDGVLNSEEWMRAGHMRSIDREAFSPELCGRLERVIQATGCDVVISSSWRVCHSVEEIAGHLHARGAPSARVIGATPKWREGKHGPIVAAYERRGHEIQAWLDANRGGCQERIAIVDDDDDMAHLRTRLVRTSWKRGLQDEHVEALIEMLGGAP